MYYTKSLYRLNFFFCDREKRGHFCEVVARIETDPEAAGFRQLPSLLRVADALYALKVLVRKHRIVVYQQRRALVRV